MDPKLVPIITMEVEFLKNHLISQMGVDGSPLAKVIEKKWEEVVRTYPLEEVIKDAASKYVEEAIRTVMKDVILSRIRDECAVLANRVMDSILGDLQADPKKEVCVWKAHGRPGGRVGYYTACETERNAVPEDGICSCGKPIKEMPG